MNNLGYLAAAYAFAWLAILAYLYSIARRQRRLEHELETLQRALERETPKGDSRAAHHI
jgi:CcmD family protein